jgi:hypothetical protein
VDRLYATRDAAELLALTAKTLRNLVSQGAFGPDETYRTSRTRRVFTERGLQRYLDEQKAKAAKLGPLFDREHKKRKKSGA